MKKLEDYRKGAIGAMMDEYERAVLEMKSIIERLSEEDFLRIADSETNDEDCRSIQTVMSHVVYAGYGYANAIRRAFSIETQPYQKRQIDYSQIIVEVDKMIDFTVATLNGKCEMSDEEIVRTIIFSNENGSENLEQLLEHAIVHILRHRRQIDKFSLKF